MFQEPKTQQIDFNSMPQHFDLHNQSALFADMVQVENNLETVTLNFLQIVPGPIGQQHVSKVVSRVVLTWAHFARLAQLFPQIAKEGSESAKQSFLNSIEEQA